MASLQKEREEFLLAMAREGVPPDVARLVLRHAATVQRLAVDDCNGVPYDRGEKPRHYWTSPTTFACGVEDHPTVKFTKRRPCVTCPACRSTFAESRILALLAPFDVVPNFQGDPRGACVKLKLKTHRGNSFGGEGLYCVPTPNY